MLHPSNTIWRFRFVSLHCGNLPKSVPTLRWLKNCLWNHSRLQCSDCVLWNPCPEKWRNLKVTFLMCHTGTKSRKARCMVTLAIGATLPNICGPGPFWHKNLPLLCGWKWTYYCGSLQSWADGKGYKVRWIDRRSPCNGLNILPTVATSTATTAGTTHGGKVSLK